MPAGQMRGEEMKRCMSHSSKAQETDVEEIVQDNRPRLLAFIRNWVGNADDADDIMQDVFYLLVKTLNDNVCQIEQVTAWLYRVARNVIINRGKRKSSHCEVSMPAGRDGSELLEEFAATLYNDDNPTPETMYLRSLVWQELEDALDELPAEQRDMFELTEFEGLSVKEISAMTGTPVNTLLSRKHYAVKHLRQRLGELYRDLTER